MWYSSQKMTKTRMSSWAASAAACSGESNRAATRSSSADGWPVAWKEFERLDLLVGAVLADVEVVLGQVAHRVAVVIDDADVDADQVGAGAKCRAAAAEWLAGGAPGLRTAAPGSAGGSRGVAGSAKSASGDKGCWPSRRSCAREQQRKNRNEQRMNRAVMSSS